MAFKLSSVVATGPKSFVFRLIIAVPEDDLLKLPVEEVNIDCKDLLFDEPCSKDQCEDARTETPDELNNELGTLQTTTAETSNGE